MDQLLDTRLSSHSSSERGSARLKFLITIAILVALAYAAYQYAPVAYEAYRFKDYMQDRVNYAAAVGRSSEWVEEQLRASSAEYGLPPNAMVKAQLRDGRMEAQVKFTRPVQLPGFVYQYDFDHTAKSVTFLTVK